MVPEAAKCVHAKQKQQLHEFGAHNKMAFLSSKKCFSSCQCIRPGPIRPLHPHQVQVEVSDEACQLRVYTDAHSTCSESGTEETPHITTQHKYDCVLI